MINYSYLPIQNLNCIIVLSFEQEDTNTQSNQNFIIFKFKKINSRVKFRLSVSPISRNFCSLQAIHNIANMNFTLVMMHPITENDFISSDFNTPMPKKKLAVNDKINI